MRTLVLTQVAPNPPDAGPKIKTHFVLRTLAQEHSVELVTFARSDEEAAAAREMEEWCDRVTTIRLERKKYLEPWYAARGWLSGQPFLVARDARSEMSRIVRDRLSAGNVDVLHADQLTMAQYLPLARGSTTQTVFDAHNAVWDLVREFAGRQATPFHRAASRIEWRMLRKFEGAVARSSDLTLVVAEHDRNMLALAAGMDIHAAVVPIGIEARCQEPVAFNPCATRLLSVATMHYPPNSEAIRWFRDDVWPYLRATCPEIGVDIVGGRPPEDLIHWGQSEPGVQVHGYVADTRDLYRQAAVFIVPLWAGSGVRVKILEAMAMGVPVVTTSIGAHGLDVQHNEHLLVADTPPAFAGAVRELLECPERRYSLSVAARRHVIDRYDWRTCCRPLLDAYRHLAGR